MRPPPYDDASVACAETGARLNIYSDHLSPEEITAIMQVEPTVCVRKGDAPSDDKDASTSTIWSFTTYATSNSKESRRHLDLVIAMLEGKDEAVNKLRKEGCAMHLAIHWVPASTGGGPWFNPIQMIRLGSLGVAVWVYFIPNYLEEAHHPR
jgi:hypothetical protein